MHGFHLTANNTTTNNVVFFSISGFENYNALDKELKYFASLLIRRQKSFKTVINIILIYY